MTKTMTKPDVHAHATLEGAAAKSFAFLEGKFVPLEDAKINIMTHAFLYGTAVFEGIRGYFNPDKKELYIFRVAEHYDRFLSNCKILKIEVPFTTSQLVDLTVEMVRKSGYRQDVYIRPIGYKSALRIGLKLDDENDFMVFGVPMGSYLAQDHALNLMVSSWRRIEDNAIPPRGKINGSYVNLSLAAAEAREHGFDEAILLNEDGSLSEAAGMNIFMIRHGVLLTPPVTDNVLEGITRNTIFEIAKDMNFACEIRSIDRSELYTADEAFLCGTGAEVAAVGKVDGRKVGTGQVGDMTRRIRDTYFSAVRGGLPQYTKWLTPVWNQ